MKREILSAVILILCLSCLLFPVKDEYYRKAALFRVISHYCLWPEEAGMSDNSSPFVIGVMGRNPFKNILEEFYSRHKIKNKKVEIRDVSYLTGIPGCHILFLSKSIKKDLLARVLAVTHSRPVLTIGETPGFAEKGVLLNFYISDNRILLEVNGTALRKSSLQMDPLLLRLARIIMPMEERE
ncbi:MAG: YfiR family protein [Candidatus Aminicenantes bacterium]|nr:YfiR family protein [Candidatus Aminicenantes bacterium]